MNTEEQKATTIELPATEPQPGKAAKRSKKAAPADAPQPQPAEAPAEEAAPAKETAKPEGPTLKEALQEQAREDEVTLTSSVTLRKILGGDFLTAERIRRQIGLILIIVAFVIVYISNRYSCQRDQLEIDRLNRELQDAKYKALSSSSMLTEKCRESHVLDMLKNNKDSVLHIADQPPYIIYVPEE